MFRDARALSLQNIARSHRLSHDSGEHNELGLLQLSTSIVGGMLHNSLSLYWPTRLSRRRGEVIIKHALHQIARAMLVLNGRQGR